MMKWIKSILLDLLNTVLLLIVIYFMTAGWLWVIDFYNASGIDNLFVLRVYIVILFIGFAYVLHNWSSKMRTIDTYDEWRKERKQRVQPNEQLQSSEQ